MGFQIAIDGAVASGKSSTAREVAVRLGFEYIDTGAMYRAVGLYAISNGVSANDEQGVAAFLSGITISLDSSRLYLNGEDVSEKIRLPEASRAASAVAIFPAVRRRLVELQRGLAGQKNVVMDGRDIGSCVLPNAGLKIYLDAPPESRAMRRYNELLLKSPGISFEEVLSDTKARDYNDMNRAESPLIKADGAVIIDNSELGFEEVVELIISLYNDIINRGQAANTHS